MFDCLVKKAVGNAYYTSQELRSDPSAHAELALLSVEWVEGEIHLALNDGVRGRVEDEPSLH